VKRERLSQAEILGWSVVGFGAGLLGGLLAAGRLGRVTSGRLGDEVRAFRARSTTSAVALASAVAAAFRADSALASLDLSAVAVSRGTVELAGWVPDRGTRARAMRVANGVPGLEAVINSILVHGEDDLAGAPDLTLADQPA
jgi:hypothetical protein